MIIEIYTKNYSLINSVVVPDGPVPRVGEAIIVQEEENLVHEVTYTLEDGALTPLVKCHGSSGSTNRRMTLEEGGWV